MTMSAPLEEAIVGAWTLEAFTISFTDDRPTVYPFGETPMGHILYSTSGHMSAVLSFSNRSSSGAEQLETAGRISDEAKAAAFDSYLSYGGRYTVEGDKVEHHVDVALVPELVGQTLRRTAALDGDRLRLTYTLTPRSGIERQYALVFRRR